MAEMRKIFTETLLNLAEENKNICMVDADLMKAAGTTPFREKYPERSFDVGVAEANMVGVAAGLSATGKIPIASSFGCFATRRAYDQFYLAANYAKQNVKLIGLDPGVTGTFNGGTHMPFEDTALVRAIPGVVIIEPSDIVSLEKLTQQACEHKGSVYMRLHRKSTLEIYTDTEEFKIGKGNVVKDGTDLTIVVSGSVMMEESLKAYEILKEKGISAAILDFHTVKPLDEELLLAYAEKTKAFITCENHQITGGLGSAVAEYLSEVHPVRISRIGVNDRFGQVGSQEYLKKEYGLTCETIVNRALDLL